MGNKFSKSEGHSTVTRKVTSDTCQGCIYNPTEDRKDPRVTDECLRVRTAYHTEGCFDLKKACQERKFFEKDDPKAGSCWGCDHHPGDGLGENVGRRCGVTGKDCYIWSKPNRYRKNKQITFTDVPVETPGDKEPFPAEGITIVDLIKEPGHYTGRGGIEPVNFIMSNKLSFAEGNAVKYIYRHTLKGSGVQDLKKAKQYIDFILKHEYGEEQDECLI